MACTNDRPTRNRLDHVFKALDNTVKRRILTALMDNSPRHLTEFESKEIRPPSVSSERFAIGLYHHYLPQLADLEFIDWDQGSGVITRGANFNEIRPVLRLLYNHQDELPDDWP